ncbi:hypothetical protein PMZ80_010027 [Knufia obscura]|uniref:Histone chaperone RTT106/FACT complex subunit SPT16-like middle domain-containing protein n=2 Tax=Knufia TaxID=430999 RepID=A0AAN8EHP8_9EURO|nr:hypothetical protein PMZ80_010027 [Knufia obscura]KAK5956114.1 hypothetical protein OHC33_002687 [Knufia fluminis]
MSNRRLASVDEAFAAAPDLRSSIYKALVGTPQYGKLFDDIGKYVLSIRSDPGGVNGASNDTPADEPPSKKRKLDEPGANGQPAQSGASSGPRRVLLEAREVTFTLPLRKKLHLGIVQYGSRLEEKNSTFAIQARNPATNQVEFEHSTSSYAYALRLPVPEKNQKQYNFCLLPSSEKAASVEPIIWTVNHGPLKSCKVEDEDLAKIAPGPDDVLENAFNHILQKTGIKLILPSEKEFASAIRESHRKNDIAYHVKAFRGSKEGYLFFLENGIFFGFKKPLSFFPFSEIESISYTSVLQRTFNLNITIRQSADAATQEIEYSMIDQQDFAGIDAYVKGHQLQDASLADARRAKKAGKAGRAAEANGGDDAEDDGRTELEKAQQEMEDEEDEMEEDYDPEEEDDGSGSESESGGEEYTRGKGRNLIAEELGSEAEDVSAEEEEEGDDEEEEEEEEEEADAAQDEVNELKAEQVSMPTHGKRNIGGPDIDDEDQL